MIEKFTTGPWKIDKYNALVDSKGVRITFSNCNITTAFYDDDEYEANSKLMVTAPEMYKLLEEIMKDEFDGGSLHRANTIKKLLAKARGE